MKFFRPAGRMEAEADTLDWTREHGYAKTSRFSFPDLYLSDDVAQLAEADPAVSVFLRQCLTQFVCHEYGHLASMDLAENYINRDIKGLSTWVRGTYPSPEWGRSAWIFSMILACSTGRERPPEPWPSHNAERNPKPMNLETMREPMKKPMLQERTIQDAIAFWQQLRHGQFRPLFAEPTENTVTQLFRYVLTGASSFLVDFLLLFLLEMLGVHYLPAAACSFAVGITCNFLLTKYFAFKSVDSTVGPAAEIAVFIAISVVGLLLTMGLMYLFTSRLHLYFMVSKLISSILVFVWNFLGRKLILYPGKAHTKV